MFGLLCKSGKSLGFTWFHLLVNKLDWLSYTQEQYYISTL